MDELTILLVEDDPVICQEMIHYADTLSDVRLVNVTSNAAQALENIRDYQPDAMILDLELQMGSGSGLEVLKGIQDQKLPCPYVLISTNNSSTVTLEYARQLGADYILSKHQGDYSAKNTIDFLYMLKDAIRSKHRYVQTQTIAEETPHQQNQRILQRIQTELNAVGISPKAKGYQYLMDAILLVAEDSQARITTVLAQKYGKSTPSVERAMQNAIDRAWNTADINDLYEHFTARIHSARGVPTLTEFVYYYANMIKAEYSSFIHCSTANF